MKKVLIIIIFTLTFLNVNAQQNFVDSLLIVKNNLENAVSLDEKRYSETVNSLIFYCINQSDYYRAKQIAESGIDKLKNNGILNDQPLRSLYCYLGLVDYYLKNYVEAMNMFAKVEQMCREVDSVSDEYLIAACNAAIICGEFQHYDDMKNIMDAAVQNYENKYGSIFKMTTEQHFLLLNNYGLANYYKGNYTLAEKCYKYVIQHCKGSFESNNALPLSYNNYSVLLIQKGRLNDAIALLKKARTLNTDYIYYLAQNIAMAYFAKWKPGKTSEVIEYYNDVAVFNISKIFADFPKTERENYWTKISMEVLPFNNMVAYFHHHPDGLKQAFNMTLFCKNLLLNSDKIIDEYVKNSSDFSLQEQYSVLLDLKQKFLFQTSDSSDAVSLKSEIQKKEEFILHNINDLHSLLYNSSKTWEDVKNSLSDDEYAVEYGLMFGPREDGGIDTLYCAIVVGKNASAPQIDFSLQVSEIDSKYIDLNGSPLFFTGLYVNHTPILYKILFETFKKLMPNARTIYYSPCGNLSQLNFDLFTDDKGTPLNKKYKMVRVSSTADIPAIKANDIISAKNAALFGNINFDSSFYETSRGYKFGKLQNAEKEIHTISEILQSHHVASTLYEDKAANEKAFKLLSGNSPEILHLATHGFCFDTKEKAANKPFAQSVNTYSQKESAMALSGLALSGANNAWKGNFDLPNVEDGILTAYEISQLDLSNTKLVVLSACETARGRIFPVDGVFGLQRAFKQAGAGSILMSLWKVDDNATATFMEYFYKFLFETNDRHEALKKAQDEVRKQYPDPYYWAAWVMLD